MRKIIVVFGVLLLVTSCVPKKKFVIAEGGRIAALSREQALQQTVEELNQKIEQLQAEIAKQKRELGEMSRKYQESLSSNMSEQEKLNMMLEEKMSQLKQRETTINELRAMIDAQNAKVAALLSSVKDALLGFNSDELTVSQRDGKVYVAMSDKLLFESGSAQVNKQGKEALGKLAEVLKKQQDIDVFIEGHTDNKPIKTVQFKDNWDLSVVRATSVVRILTVDYGMSPLQVVPSGRGEFMPLADNNVAEGRSKNRRTEIIIAPKLDKLFEMLK